MWLDALFVVCAAGAVLIMSCLLNTVFQMLPGSDWFDDLLPRPRPRHAV